MKCLNNPICIGKIMERKSTLLSAYDQKAETPLVLYSTQPEQLT